MATIYDDEYLKTGQDKLKALIDALKTTMAVGYDPTFSYTYEGHQNANMEFSAVSIDSVSETTEPLAWQGNIVINHEVEYSIRVHIGYTDDLIDEVKASRLITSVANKLWGNLILGDNFKIIGVTEIIHNVQFEETDTTGAELFVTVRAAIAHTQE